MTTRIPARPLALAVLGASLLLAAGPTAQDAGGGQAPADGHGPLSLAAPAILGGDAIPDLIVSPESGGVPTRVLSGANGAQLGAGFPFSPGVGVRTAVGDLTGDGVADIVAGMGPGGNLVLLLDGATATPLGSGAPFGGFGGGVYVAVGDVNNDGRNDIIVGQGTGGGGVSVFSGIDYSPLWNLAPFGGGYGGGVTVAAGDVNGDGFADLVVGQATGGLVSIVDGASRTPIVTGPPYGGGFGGGVHVAAGDVNGNGRAEIVLAPGAGAGPVLVYDVVTLTQLASFFPYGAGFGAGIRLATADFTGDGQAEIVTAPGPGGGSTVAVFLGGTFAPFVALPVYGGYSGGVNVAAPASTGIRFTSAASAGFTVGQAGTFTVRAVGAPAVNSITFTGTLPAGVTFTNNGDGTATLAGTPGGPGASFPLVFTASNGVSTPVQQAFTLTVQQPPAITSANATTFPLGAAGTFTVTTTGFPAPTLSVTGALPAGVTFTNNGNGTATLAGTPQAGTGGSYPLTITATNGAGTPAQQSFTLTVSSAPVITSATSTTFTTGAAGTFTVTTAASPSVTTITRTGALPGGVTFTDNGNGTATLAGTPQAGTGGTYPLTFTASNSVGAPAVQNFTLTVQQAPAITSAASTTFALGVAGTFTVTTTGFPTPTLSRTGTLPSGVTFTPNGNGTATLAGTPAPGTVGVYPITITATNGVGGAVQQSFTLTVDDGAVITSANATTFNIGSANTFTVTTAGTPPVTTITRTGALPTGVTFTDNGNGTATLAGNPAAGTAGAYPLTFTASNGVGTPFQQSFTLTVVQPPVATNDTYSNGVGNTQYSVGAGTPVTPAVVVAGTVLGNDAGSAVPLSVGPASIATTQGGQVAMSTDGTFIYTPPAGFSGPSDTFTYTLTDANSNTDTAVVTINLSAIVYYVNATAPAGDGRSHSPFNTINAALAVSGTNDVYVHAGAYTTSLTPLANQRIWGAGVVYTLNGLTIPAGTNPVVTGTLTLANGNVVNGVSINGDTAAAIVGGAGLTTTASLTGVSITGGATGLTLTNVPGTVTLTGGAFSGITGADALISGGTGAVNVGAAITNTAGRSVDVQNRTGGTVTFSGLISDTGTGIFLNNNTGATVAFTGGMAVSTGVNDAFTATGGGTVTATQNNTTIVNTLATTDGVALRVANTQIGAAGLTFRSISAGTLLASTGAGIILDTTGVAVGNGGLTITGNGTASSGGVIRRKNGADGSLTTGVGIYLNNTKNPTFNRLELFDFQNFGIVGRNVSGFQLIDSSVGGQIGTTTGEGPVIFGTPNPAGVNGIIGTGVLRNSNIQGGYEHNAAFYNQTGAVTLQLERTTATPGDCQFSFNNTTTGAHGVVVQLEGTATGTVSFTQCRVRDNRGIGFLAYATDDANLTLTVTGSEVVRNSQGTEGMVVTNAVNADITASITGTNFSNYDGAGLRVGQVSGNASALSLLRASITNNTFQKPATSTDAGLVARLSGTAGVATPSQLILSGNTVMQFGPVPGIAVRTPDAGTTPVVDVTITNNHVDMNDVDQTTPGARGLVGMLIQANQATPTNLCANVLNNTVHWFPTTVGTGGGIVAEQGSTATFRLERGTQTLGTAPATVLEQNNSAGPAGPSTVSVLGTLTVVENASCTVPVIP